MKKLFLAFVLVFGAVAAVWGVVLIRHHGRWNTDAAATREAASTAPVAATARASNPAAKDPIVGFSRTKLFNRLSDARARPTPFRQLKGAEGYWRLAQDWSDDPADLDTTSGSPPNLGGGPWWFLSPEGKREWLNTVTTVQPFQLARDTNGPHFVSRDYDGGITENGNIRAWAEKTLARVRDAGFKGLGGWCNPAFHDLPVPVTRDLNLWKWVSGDKNQVLLFSPDWARLAEVAVQKQVIPLRENRNLVGYFTDNEIEWGDGWVGPRVYFDHKSPDDPNRREVTKVIRKMWPEVAAFNADWGTSLANWEDLDKLDQLPLDFGGKGGRQGNYSAYVRLLSVWMEHAARHYFELTTRLVRQYDPNHLILGVRFKNWAPPEIVRASKGLTDAQSLNTYVGDARLDREMYEMMHLESGGQPVMITEYSFHSLDGRSGNRNTVGFLAQVLDQRARAEGYRLMTTRLARVPWVIGADWFQWADEPPSGRHFDGEDVNFGIVDIDDRPYEHMVRAVRETTPLLNAYHERSSREQRGMLGQGFVSADASGTDNTLAGDSDIWRESYAIKPIARVPYLTRVPAINGELSDWPANARVAGVRHSRTLGLERTRVPLPNVYMGWREEGLYLAFEVFDDDIQGADPKGWWWTRDAVEWWIATRPPLPGQNYFDGWSHQFFFVPREFPSDGVSGVVGRWHRPGDAITDNLVPEPHVRQVSRVLPGRYVVEMLLPGASLNGWDPADHPRLAFNLHVRNWQHAIDCFWSAPKEMQTQLRPGTWGELYLLPRTSP